MAHATSRKNWIMIIIGIISLMGLLSYTFVHTGNLLATYVEPRIVGFLAAAGIELSIIALSMRIGELRKSGLSTRYFFGSLVMVVVVSAVANIAQGFYVRYGEPITILNFQKLDLVEAFIAVAATGLISLITLALSEIVGQDVITIQKNQKKSTTSDPMDGGYTIVPTHQEISSAPERPLLDSPKGNDSIPSDEKFRELMIAMGENAPKSVSEVEKVFGMSHATAARKLRTYREQKNG